MSLPYALLADLLPASLLVIVVVTLLLMLGDRITTRLAMRNFMRRKKIVVLVMLGLLVGTALISGSLVMGDSVTAVSTRQAYSSFGRVDEGVYYHDPLYGYAFFNYSLYDQLRSRLVDNKDVAGITPEVVSYISVFDENTHVGQPGVALVGVDPNATAALGNFEDPAGKVLNPDTGSTGAIINHQLARDIGASVGDTLKLLLGQKAKTFAVTGIDYSFERSGSPGGADHVVVALPAAQSFLEVHGSINFIALTNIGGATRSISFTGEVGSAANDTLSSLNQGLRFALHAFGDKNASVAGAVSNSSVTGTAFLILNSFTIAAGVVLIVNMFVMLAEERKHEMGVARALGMKRMHLIKQFVFEGFFYSLVSSAVGVAVGIGVAYVLILIYSPSANILSFGGQGPSGNILQGFSFSQQTLLTSFAVGVLITYATIMFSSWRVSRLNIVRAVRDIPEPPRERRGYTRLLITGIAILSLGISSLLTGLSLKSDLVFISGPAIVLIGIGLALARILGDRYAFSISSLGILVYWGYPQFSVKNPLVPCACHSASSTLPYVEGAFFMVVAAVVLVIYNIHPLMKGLSKVSRVGWKAIFNVGLSYPSNKRSRTAASLLMFSIVIFVIVGIGTVSTLFQTVSSQQYNALSGGYDIAATTTVPVQKLAGQIIGDSNLSASTITHIVDFEGGYVLTKDLTIGSQMPFSTFYLGANASASYGETFYSANTFNITRAAQTFRLPNGAIDSQGVWSDVASNPQHVVLALSLLQGYLAQGYPASEQRNPGDIITVSLPGGTTRNVTIIALMTWVGPNCLLTTAQAAQAAAALPGSHLALVALGDKSKADGVSITLKRDFLSDGIEAVVLPDLFASYTQSVLAGSALLQGFLTFGLTIGIAGLSIITLRSVIERRREIGITRALGFTRKMVLASFLLENSFIAVLGIVIGSAVGVLWGNGFITFLAAKQAPEVIPYANIAEVSLISYTFVILGTVWPALKASRTPPAEAVRYAE